MNFFPDNKGSLNVNPIFERFVSATLIKYILFDSIVLFKIRVFLYRVISTLIMAFQEENPSFPVGSLVHHSARPHVRFWTVVGSTRGAHLLRSSPDDDGYYECMRGDGCNLTLVLGMSLLDLKEGRSKLTL